MSKKKQRKKRMGRSLKRARRQRLILLILIAITGLCAVLNRVFSRNNEPQAADDPAANSQEYDQPVCEQDFSQLNVPGIDVSSFQGEIDWNAVAQNGVQFAFIRLAVRGYQTGEIYMDEKFWDNLIGAREAGLKVGVYFFSQSISSQEALEEAQYVLDTLDGTELDLPVVFDFELPSDETARTHVLEEEEICQQARDFLGLIEASGYQGMLYTNGALYPTYANGGLLDDYPLWYAVYGVNAPTVCDVDIWQSSDTGWVDGIADHHVDLDWMRADFQ